MTSVFELKREAKSYIGLLGVGGGAGAFFGAGAICLGTPGAVFFGGPAGAGAIFLGATGAGAAACLGGAGAGAAFFGAGGAGAVFFGADGAGAVFFGAGGAGAAFFGAGGAGAAATGGAAAGGGLAGAATGAGGRGAAATGAGGLGAETGVGGRGAGAGCTGAGVTSGTTIGVCTYDGLDSALVGATYAEVDGWAFGCDAVQPELARRRRHSKTPATMSAMRAMPPTAPPAMAPIGRSDPAGLGD